MMKRYTYNSHLLGIILIAILNFQSGCPCQDCEYGVVDRKLFFISQVEDTIYFYKGDCFDFTRSQPLDMTSFTKILPGDTLIINSPGEGTGLDNINQVIIVLYSDSWCKLEYSQSNKCDYWDSKHIGSFSLVESYEIKKLVSRRQLEFTYFFTEAKKEKAGSCR